MKRLHVHIAVDDLAKNIAFYSTLFGSEPTVQKADYAKWMLEDPRVNFAISSRGAKPGLNHLGIQVESDAELAALHGQLEQLQADVVEEMGTACCYARSDKYWVNDPQGIAWESYHTLDSVPMFAGESDSLANSDCCVPQAVQPVALGMPKAAPKKSGCCG